MILASALVPWHNVTDFLGDAAVGAVVALTIFCLWGWLAKPPDRQQKSPHTVADDEWIQEQERREASQVETGERLADIQARLRDDQ